jgi:hypothetical protein
MLHQAVSALTPPADMPWPSYQISLTIPPRRPRKAKPLCLAGDRDRPGVADASAIVDVARRHLSDVGLMIERVGGGSRAQRLVGTEYDVAAADVAARRVRRPNHLRATAALCAQFDICLWRIVSRPWRRPFRTGHPASTPGPSARADMNSAGIRHIPSLVGGPKVAYCGKGPHRPIT